MAIISWTIGPLRLIPWMEILSMNEHPHLLMLPYEYRFSKVSATHFFLSDLVHPYGN